MLRLGQVKLIFCLASPARAKKKGPHLCFLFAKCPHLCNLFHLFQTILQCFDFVRSSKLQKTTQHNRTKDMWFKQLNSLEGVEKTKVYCYVQDELSLHFYCLKVRPIWICSIKHLTRKAFVFYVCWALKLDNVASSLLLLLVLREMSTEVG